jgi:hypothetical protein
LSTLIHFITNLSFAVGFSAGGILGYLVRLFVEDRFARDRIKFQIEETQINKSAEELRTALLPAITRLNAEPWNTFAIVREEFPKHLAAVIAFANLRPCARNKRFQEAWQKYQTYQQQTPENAVCSPKRSLILNEEAWCKNAQEALSHINHLLEFAKPK